MNPRQRIGQIVTTLASLVGIPISITLLMIHVRTKVGDTSGAAELCAASGNVDCSVAAASDYSELFGIPIAALGLAFYVGTLLVALIAPTLVTAKEPTEAQERTPGLTVFGVYTLAFAGSVFLAVVSLTQLDKICDKCFWLYVVNTVGFIGTGVWAAGNPLAALKDLLGRFTSVVGSAPAAVFALTFVAAVGGSLWQTNRMVAQHEQQPQMQTALVSTTVESQEVLNRPDAPSVGPEDAPVTIVEFSDFQCPYCARLSAALAELTELYPRELRVVYRNFPLSHHPNARLVARMSVCAQAQNRFIPFHNAAFAQQSSLHNGFTVDRLIALAESVGMNGDEARDCLDSSFSENAVERDVQDGRTLEIRGTPTIYINGRAYSGGIETPALRSVIDALLREATPPAAE